MVATAPGTRTVVRKKLDRVIRVLSRQDNGSILVEIEESGPRSFKLTHYYVCPISADFGRAFRWSKFACEGGEVYAVNVGDPARSEPASCECKGHLKHGHKTICRHVAGSRALIEASKL